ncbi:diguanylate cyclase [Sulfurimonas sp. MAG313]|nr:diguanylate cyclase [Sulfurimonas sp. MAG313]MDF1880623.1 diguanylate cyclase [Sulfurimonas sp. MAG313]
MSEKHILIIESNVKNLEVLVDLFEKQEYKVSSLHSEEELIALSDFKEYQAVIINKQVKFVQALDFVNRVNESHIPHIPVIFLDTAAKHDANSLKICLEAGAVEYIKKPFDTNELLLRIDLHIKMFLERAQYKLRVDKLGHLATVDQLSKLSSKMHMQVILKHQFDLFKRYTNPTTLIYMRLLETRRSVDTFGFEHGEKMIVGFSKELKKILRESDVAARWQGSDFVIFLPHTTLEETYIVAKKLSTFLSKKDILPDTRPHMAFGLTEFQEDDTVSSLIAKGKSALNTASKKTFDRICDC